LRTIGQVIAHPGDLEGIGVIVRLDGHTHYINGEGRHDKVPCFLSGNFLKKHRPQAPGSREPISRPRRIANHNTPGTCDPTGSLAYAAD
jgi:hypothetical protein